MNETVRVETNRFLLNRWLPHSWYAVILVNFGFVRGWYKPGYGPTNHPRRAG